MRRGDYTETRAARELRAAEQPGPTGLLDIIYITAFILREHTFYNAGGRTKHTHTHTVHTEN